MQSLWEAFKNDFSIGATVSPRMLEKAPEFIAKHFNSITAENEMKFYKLHPDRGTYDFSEADGMIHFAKEHDIRVRGHNLVWHQQTPDWVFMSDRGEIATKQELLNVMKEHIQIVVEHFRESIYCWDVVNEAIEDGDGYLRESKWFRIIGEEYIEKAFRFAHQAAPDALLFYNDYNAVKEDKCQKIYTLVKDLLSKDVPIHGIGIQGHWNLYWPHEDEVRRAFEKYISLGLKLHITELDVSMYSEEMGNLGLKEPTSQMLEMQAQRYETFFRIFKEYREHITSITFWGVADDYTWLDNFPVKGRKNWPFVFDVNYEPKLAYYKILGL